MLSFLSLASNTSDPQDTWLHTHTHAYIRFIFHVGQMCVQTRICRPVPVSITRREKETWRRGRKGILITSHTKGLVSVSHPAMTFGICRIVKISLTYKTSGSKRHMRVVRQIICLYFNYVTQERMCITLECISIPFLSYTIMNYFCITLKNQPTI